MNLKQAARRLGVHYQTAYKLVRSGRLAAVCVGARYEISDAAIEHYLAERQAMRRAPMPARAGVEPANADPFGPAVAALDAVVTSAPTVFELVADALVTSLGDLAVVRELAPDRMRFLPAVVRHADPARRAVVAAAVGQKTTELADSRTLGAVANGETILKPLVPQDCVRSRLDSEAIQHFDEAGIHSMIVAPAAGGGEVLGLVGVTRDAPGRPYSRSDVETVERAAVIVGTAIARGRLTEASAERRRALVHAVTNTLEAGNSSPPVDAVLGDGPVAEFVCDPSGRILTANATASRLLEVASAELIGRSLSDLFGAKVRDQHVALLARMVRGELAYADLAVGTGGRHQVTMRFAVVRDAQAQPRAVVAVAYGLPQL